MEATASTLRRARERRLAARLTATTALSFGQAFDAIRRVCERESEVRRGPHHVQTRGTHILIGYRASPPHAGMLAGHWLVAVRFPRDDHTDRTTAQKQTIEIRLTNWVVDPDGRREPSDGHRELVDAICEVVGAQEIR